MGTQRCDSDGEQLSDFIIARRRWIDAGKPERSDLRAMEILDICRVCEYYKSIRPKLGRCLKCGCALNLSRGLNKLRWATESCPVGKWEREVDVMELTRREKREERIRRRNERRQQQSESETPKQKRIRERNERRAKLGKVNPVVVLPPNTDPLKVYDRFDQVTHSIRDAWKLCPAFLVCGGPSVNEIDTTLLADPAVMSLAVNNVAAHVPVKAFVYSDPTEKFHGGLFLHPGIIKFAPRGKLKDQIRLKNDKGEFEFASVRVIDCPNVWGYDRNTRFVPSEFLTCEEASWGVNAGKHPDMAGRAKVLFTPFIALRLLHYLGVRTVFLLGMDFFMTTDNGYAFNQARTTGAAASNNEHYRIVNGMMHELRPQLEQSGMKVYNCNPKSRLSAFDYLPYTDAVNSCTALIPKKPWDLSLWYEKDPSNPKVE